MLRHPLAQLRKDALTAVLRLLKRVDHMRLTRISVRLLPCTVLVGNPARLHLNGEDAVPRMQHDEIRLPLRSRTHALSTEKTECRQRHSVFCC